MIISHHCCNVCGHFIALQHMGVLRIATLTQENFWHVQEMNGCLALLVFNVFMLQKFMLGFLNTQCSASPHTIMVCRRMFVYHSTPDINYFSTFQLVVMSHIVMVHIQIWGIIGTTFPHSAIHYCHYLLLCIVGDIKM